MKADTTGRSVRRARAWWSISAREARAHAFILGGALWTVALVYAFAGPGYRSIAGPMKGADYIYLYTMGHLAASHRPSALYEYEEFHRAQAELVPEAANQVYPPAVYPPQAALVFGLFSYWSYGVSALAWALCTVIGYAAMTYRAWRPVRAVLQDGLLVAAAAAAFPPFWNLVLHTQATILILAAFFLGWLALERGHRYLAGLAFGLLAVKPQFGLPLAVIVLWHREWAMLAGAVTSVLVQIGVVLLILGSPALTGFVHVLLSMLGNVDILEPRPFMAHSIRSLTRLMPPALGLPIWAGLCGGVLWLTGRMWGTEHPLRVRLGVVILASVLVNPHVVIYDATVLVLPLLWFGAFFQERGDARFYWPVVYLLFIAFLAPTAALIGIQCSVLLMAWLLLYATRREHNAPSALAA